MGSWATEDTEVSGSWGREDLGELATENTEGTEGEWSGFGAVWRGACKVLIARVGISFLGALGDEIF